MRKQLTSIFFLFCFSVIAVPQTRSARPEVSYSSTCISMDDGLTNSFVTTILRDRRGDIWVGTLNGLDFFSFAGHVHYPLDREGVNSLAEGADGAIWASTSKGTYVFDRTKSSFDQVADGIRGHCSRVGDEIWVYDGYALNIFANKTTDTPRQVVFPSNISIHTVKLPSSTLQLASLAPGTYTVSAVCLPLDEVAQSEPAVVRIVIDQVWYRTVSFMIFLVLLVSILSSVLIYSIAKRKMQRNGLVESAISKRDRALIESLDNFVKENMSEEISASTLTVALGISRSALYDKVKMITGYSLNDYIKRMRIEEAIRLLKETEMNINEISYNVGFTYPRYFSSVFKELTGSSPTQYRKNIKHQ